MGVDLLRSCYSTRMRLFRDSTEETDIVWYKCEPGVKPLPFHTVFASRNWNAPDKDWIGLGEVPGAPRAWTNCAKPI